MVEPPSQETDFASSTAVSSSVQLGRRRSVSIAETHPSVETVMAKAKRAALSLWMLLHAQNCTLGQKCPHTGCQEAKLLHLHLKTCHTNADGACPLRYHGCDQSRKLLAHHRRCKALRLKRQQRPNGSTTASAADQHYCLVCSLVARQARTLLTTTTTCPRVTNVTSKSSPNKKLSSPRTATFAISTKIPPATDSLRHLYEMAKQLDDRSSMGGSSTTTATVRSRAVSDAELVDQKAAVSHHHRTRQRSASLGTSPNIETITEEELEGEQQQGR